jgi:hypothetical protein
MAQQVWYSLHYRQSDTSILNKVRVDGDIADLQQAVYNDNDNVLVGLKKTNLAVYPVGTDFTTINASTPTIELDTLASTLVTTARRPVIVVARAPLSPTSTPTLSSVSTEIQALPQHELATQYWSKLLQSSIIDHAIDLTPAQALGVEDLPSRVYIRDHYHGIFNKMQQMAPHHRFIIRGTPGIGKSIFAVYLMYQHRNIGTIVYHPRNSDVVFLYMKDRDNDVPTVYVCNKSSVRLGLYLQEKTTLYIVDGQVPRYDTQVRCSCVMITSPNYKLENEYGKASGSPLIMPTWELSELQLCRELSFKHVSFERVEQLYHT